MRNCRRANFQCAIISCFGLLVLLVSKITTASVSVGPPSNDWSSDCGFDGNSRTPDGVVQISFRRRQPGWIGFAVFNPTQHVLLVLVVYPVDGSPPTITEYKQMDNNGSFSSLNVMPRSSGMIIDTTKDQFEVSITTTKVAGTQLVSGWDIYFGCGELNRQGQPHINMNYAPSNRADWWLHSSVGHMEFEYYTKASTPPTMIFTKSPVSWGPGGGEPIELGPPTMLITQSPVVAAPEGEQPHTQGPSVDPLTVQQDTQTPSTSPLGRTYVPSFPNITKQPTFQDTIVVTSIRPQMPSRYPTSNAENRPQNSQAPTSSAEYPSAFTSYVLMSVVWLFTLRATVD